MKKYEVLCILLFISNKSYGMEPQKLSLEQLVFKASAEEPKEIESIKLLLQNDATQIEVKTTFFKNLFTNKQPLSPTQQLLSNAWDTYCVENSIKPPVAVRLNPNVSCTALLMPGNDIGFIFLATCNKNDVRHLIS